MTKQDAKELALRILDEATINGQPAGVELTADYTDKFDYFLNDALVFIANLFPLNTTVSIKFYTPYQVRGPYVRVELPDDCLKIRNIIAYDSDGGFQDVEYKEDTETSVLVSKATMDKFPNIDLTYNRLPEEVAPDAPDDTVLDISRKAEGFLPLKLAVDATAGNEETASISSFLSSRLDNSFVNLLGDGDKSYAVEVERVYYI